MRRRRKNGVGMLRYSLKIICAPTSEYTNDEMDQFYDEIERALNKDKIFYTFLMGDFNTKLGKEEANEIIEVKD